MAYFTLYTTLTILTLYKTILVLSVISKQGGIVINNILALPKASFFAITIVTYNAASLKAQKLAALPNVTIIQEEILNLEDIFCQVGPV